MVCHRPAVGHTMLPPCAPAPHHAVVPVSTKPADPHSPITPSTPTSTPHSPTQSPRPTSTPTVTPTIAELDSSPPTSTNHATSHNLSPPSPPPPIRTHPMVTHSQNNIFKPKTLHHATMASPLPSPKPTCVPQAIKDPHWRRAMSEEFNALIRQGTWELVPSHPDQHVLGCKWIFRIKRGKDGSITRYKARLVAKGFHQRPGSDYLNTFSPVIKPTTIRTVLSLAVSRRWPLKQLDVNNAFLHGELDEELYMQQPAGFIDQTHPSHVCRLRKSIYGLKQAPRAWFRALKAFLLSQGFFNSKSDSSLFIYNRGSVVIYFLVYVDDIIVTGNNISFITSLIRTMGHRFSLKEPSDLSYFLGIEAVSVNDGLFLSQHRYIQDLLQKSGMTEAKPVATPLASTSNLLLHTGVTLPDGSDYRKLVGSLQYLALTRPDISFAVSRLSQFMHKPTDVHWQALKRVLRYLRGTTSHGILLRPQQSLSLHAFSDADWAGDRDTCLSTTGYIVFLGGNPISWRAAKQRAVARSSTEAEYRALAASSSELVWVIHLLNELGIPVTDPPALYCDNVSATYLSSNPVLHSRMKHIAVDLHFVRDLVDKTILRVSHIASNDQLADGFTKPLPSTRFICLRDKIGVADGTSILRGRVKEGCVLVISAHKGEFETGYERGGQTREPVQLAQTLGVSTLFVVVNKMEDPIVKWSKERYDEIESKMIPFLRFLGYNVKKRSKGPFRMPIIDKFKDMGTVIMGKVESGTMREGDSLLVMPNKAQVKVLAIYWDEDKATCAGPGENLWVKLSGIEEEDILSGFVLCGVAGYKAVLHVHSVVEECKIVELLQQIDPKTKKPIIMNVFHSARYHPPA
ncbi:hypothetical protein SLEP1_g56374 [Rubroshorea leprosula]|uniref:Reverse transcriptase Ty1/copia-type domain-containing protein n=1 Tax=Rubroshorea leprosula TaxID=152421 RepID=A0AAV5MJG9_9ROSI|nr:hypothetical protein SLEP1_g56374 [Rubroshorea leprosula]